MDSKEDDLDDKMFAALRNYAGFSHENCRRLKVSLSEMPDSCMSGGFVLWALCGCPQAWKPETIDIFLSYKIRPQDFIKCIGGKIVFTTLELEDKFPESHSVRILANFGTDFDRQVCMVVTIAELSGKSLLEWVDDVFDVSVCKAMWPTTTGLDSKMMLRRAQKNQHVLAQVTAKQAEFRCNHVSMQKQAERFRLYAQRGFAMTCVPLARDYFENAGSNMSESFWMPRGNLNVTWLQAISYDTRFARCGPSKPGELSALVYLGQMQRRPELNLRFPSPVPLDPRFVAVRGARPSTIIQQCAWTKWPISRISDGLFPLFKNPSQAEWQNIGLAFVDVEQLTQLLNKSSKNCMYGPHTCLWSHLELVHIHYYRSEYTLVFSPQIVEMARTWQPKAQEEPRVAELRKYVCDEVAFMITEYLPPNEAWGMVWNTTSWMGRVQPAWFQTHLTRYFKQMVAGRKLNDEIIWRFLRCLAYGFLDDNQHSIDELLEHIKTNVRWWDWIPEVHDVFLFIIDPADRTKKSESKMSALAVHLVVQQLMFQQCGGSALMDSIETRCLLKNQHLHSVPQYVIFECYVRESIAMASQTDLKRKTIGGSGFPQLSLIDVGKECDISLCVLHACGSSSHLHIDDRYGHAINIYIAESKEDRGEPYPKRQRFCM